MTQVFYLVTEEAAFEIFRVTPASEHSEYFMDISDVFPDGVPVYIGVFKIYQTALRDVSFALLDTSMSFIGVLCLELGWFKESFCKEFLFQLLVGHFDKFRLGLVYPLCLTSCIAPFLVPIAVPQ